MAPLPFLLVCQIVVLCPLQGVIILTVPPDPGTGTYTSLPSMIDLDGNGTGEFGFRARTVQASLIFFEMTVSPSTSVVQFNPSEMGLRELNLDQNVSVDSLESRPLFSYTRFGGEDGEIGRTVLASYSGFSDEGEGEFFQTTGYLGFSFEGDEGTHYGYIHIDGRRVSNYRILSYAYESEPNTPILTGAVPEPSTTLLMMLFPVAVWRRRRIGT